MYLILALAEATPTPVAPSTPTLVQATLAAPGNPPFHLKATITERGDPTSKSEVEIFWIAPDKWRRTIESKTEFSQTLIVNGDKVFEHDSDDYFPLWSQTLVTALIDPKPVLDALMPGDRLVTVANGGADPSGKVCLPPPGKACFPLRYGVMESVGAAGHSVDFTDYRDFHGKRVARVLIYHVDPGDSYQAQVTELKDLKSADESLFSIASTSAENQQIKSLILPEAELRSMALEPLEIVWPQVLDGATSGTTSYYISVDRSGRVAEVLPVSLAIERADGSARRQIMKWKFKPALKDGIPVQAGGVLHFDFNTRRYGPSNPLTDAEVRKLVSNTVEPAFAARIAPSGTTYSLSVAVDEAGDVIEVIAGEGPPQLFTPCNQAIAKWQFSPILEDGKPRPYRAQLVFRVP
jgi:hypothetical protein